MERIKTYLQLAGMVAIGATMVFIFYFAMLYESIILTILFLIIFAMVMNWIGKKDIGYDWR